MIVALYALRAVVALLASRRLPALRPLAQARLAVLLAAELFYLREPRLVAALSIALPGIVLAPALTRVGRSAADRQPPERIVKWLGGSSTWAVLAYLAAGALAAALYQPHARLWPAALVAARVVAAALLVLAARRRWPWTWVDGAALAAPAVGVVGLVLGVWPLARPGLEVLRASWPRYVPVDVAASSALELTCVLAAWLRRR